MKINEILTEAVKQRLDAKCWKGKHKEGTKIKGGVRVNNCVPNESINEAKQLSVEQLATISDAALDSAYGYGRSQPGNTFGWQANLKSAAFAKQMIDRGVTDIEAISNAIHKGWNVTAQAFVKNPMMFDDSKTMAPEKLEAKIAQRQKLMTQNYAQLPEEEKEKDRVVARAMLQAITGGQQGVAEGLNEFTPDNGGEITERINQKSIQAGFKDHQKVMGGKFDLYADSDGRTLTVELHDPNADFWEKAAWARFEVKGLFFMKNLQSLKTWVEPQYRRMGLATTIYQYVQNLGNTIKPAVVRTDMGKAMWKGFKSKGVAEDTELAEEFDLIESIIDNLALHNGVDAEVIWEDLESLSDDELYVFATTVPVMEDWQKVNKRDKTDGMSRKAVNSYRREHPGSKLKTAVTTKPSKLKKGSKASKRRSSYCSRSRGQMKMHNISCAKTPDKAICKARRRWNC